MMNNRDKIICVVYSSIAIVALPATWINNIAFMTQANNSSMFDFVRAVYINPAAASLTNDLLLVAFAACMFMVLEGRRLGIRYLWLYLVLSALIAISVTFPLFLLARHLKLASEREVSIAETHS
jgi:hypothetical protein